MENRLKTVIIFFVFILFNSVCFSQEAISISPYWLKTAEEKRKIDIENYEKYSIINLDSLTIDSIRKFLYYHGNVFSLNKIYSPSTYSIKAFVRDGLDDFGIYNFGFETFHSNKFFLFKENDTLDFVIDINGIKKRAFIKKARMFYKKHQKYFLSKSENEMVREIKVFYKKYNTWIVVSKKT